MRPREPIRTERLVLVPVTLEVAAAVIAGDLSGLTAGQGWPHADTLDGLRLAVEHGAEAGWFVTFAGAVVGDCGTHGPPDEAGAVEIGYGLAGPHRGRGIGTETCRALTGWLLGQDDVRRVVASTHRSANPASRRVLEKSGFAYDHDEGELAWYVRDA